MHSRQKAKTMWLTGQVESIPFLLLQLFGEEFAATNKKNDDESGAGCVLVASRDCVT